jgi:ABC-type Fe3+-citrate transport system substrate-binding protein
MRGLVMCEQNRLNCMINIGELAELAPRLLCVQLKGGFSEFWNRLRTVAKAINKQTHLDCKLAALVAIRKSIAPGNHWSFYLQAHETHQRRELEILEEWRAAAGTTTSKD